MSIRPRKKSNSFAHKRSFLSALAVINKKFIANLVGRIWASNLSQNSIDTVTSTKYENNDPLFIVALRLNAFVKNAVAFL